MNRLIKIFTFYTVLIFFLFGNFSPAWSGKGDVDLEFKDRTFSAHLRDVPLKVILEKLEREKGIWFKDDSSLLEEKVSVQFTDLSLQEGLKRILASTNYAIMFDRNKKLVGVIMISRSSMGRSIARNRNVTVKGTTSMEAFRESASSSSMFKVVRNSPPPGNPNIEPIDMKIVKNCPPPENPNAPPIDIDTTVVKNCPPPGNPDVEPIDMTVIKNSPPPRN